MTKYKNMPKCDWFSDGFSYDVLKVELKCEFSSLHSKNTNINAAIVCNFPPSRQKTKPFMDVIMEIMASNLQVGVSHGGC